MARIGDFGTAAVEQAPVDLDTFGYFGQEFRVHPALAEIPDLVMADVAELIVAADTAPGVQMMAMTKQLLRLVVHPEDFAKVWALAIENRQDIEAVSEITQGIIAAVTGRPTEQQPASSGGLLSTTASSEDESLSVQQGLESKGRSDLARVVQMTREGASA